MESVIKWQTGEPKEGGQYLVTTSLGVVSTDVWLKDAKRWYEYSEDYFDVVIAWCNLSDIEPYKE